MISPEELAEMKQAIAAPNHYRVYGTPVSDVGRLIAEVERLRIVLEWYAKDENYDEGMRSFYRGISNVQLDGGQRAEDALK